MQIRPERADDFDTVEEIVRAAFDSDAEPALVRKIRAADTYVPDLSLVAVEDDAVVGHIMLSYVSLGPHRVLQLAPLAVSPARQSDGIGDLLSREALSRADQRLEPLVLVLGHPKYYPRFGFESARALGIEPPDENIPDEAWMARRLTTYTPNLTGTVDFGPAFAGT